MWRFLVELNATKIKFLLICSYAICSSAIWKDTLIEICIRMLHIVGLAYSLQSCFNDCVFNKSLQKKLVIPVVLGLRLLLRP